MPLDLHTTQPFAASLLSLADAKTHLKVPDDDVAEDVYIQGLVLAATQWIEKVTGRCMGKDVGYRQVMDGFPQRLETVPRPPIPLYRGPVKAVTLVSYRDSNGQDQTLTSPDGYLLSSTSTVPAWLIPPRSTRMWPVDRIDPEPGAVTIEFTACVPLDGNGDPAPPPLAVQGCRLLVAHMFENREAGDVGRVSSEFRDRLRTFLAPIRSSLI